MIFWANVRRHLLFDHSSLNIEYLKKKSNTNSIKFNGNVSSSNSISHLKHRKMVFIELSNWPKEHRLLIVFVGDEAFHLYCITYESDDQIRCSIRKFVERVAAYEVCHLRRSHSL